jgi:putative addiction module component (TIGR02574 family)
MSVDWQRGSPYNISMTRDATELLEKALRLPPKARAALIASLIESLDGTSDEDAEVAWQAEIDRRARALDEGEVKLVPWAEARRQILDE